MRARPPHWAGPGAQVQHTSNYCSSAVGPYIDGSGTLLRRR